MSDDDVDHELLALLRQKFGLGGSNPNAPPETKVLENAQFIYDNSIDVALSMAHTKLAAIAVAEEMQKREYSTKTWAEHELHPKAKDEATVNFIFTMDLLNFSFWSEKSDEERFTVDYKGRKWTGYWSLVASLQRALDEGIPITSPEFWFDEGMYGKEESPKETRPSWVDPDAPRLPNDAFNTTVPISEGAATSSQKIPPAWEDPEAPRLPNDAFDTGVYPDPPSTQQPTANNPAVTDSFEAVNSTSPIQPGRSSEDGPGETDPIWHEALESQVEEVEGKTVTPTGSDSEENSPIPQRVRCTDETLRHVFRSSTAEEIPMFAERARCLREAGRVLYKHFDGSVLTLIQDANGSAARLVNLLADRFTCFRDEATFERKKVRFLKRAQIFVADLWAAFEGEGHGSFNDIDKLTMFAGMRFPCKAR